VLGAAQVAVAGVIAHVGRNDGAAPLRTAVTRLLGYVATTTELSMPRPNLPPLAALALLALTVTVNAQEVFVTMRAATQLSVATTATPISTQQLPPGPLTPTGQLSIPGTNSARSAWLNVSGSAAAKAVWSHQLHGSAQAGQHDVVVEFTATAPVTIGFAIEHLLAADVGTTVPLVAVDIGDDGSYEIYQGSAFAQNFGNYTLTTQPLPVRIRFAGSTAGGSMQSQITLRALPQNNVLVLPYGTGCLGGTMDVQPSFQGTGVVALAYSPPINVPSVLVLGLAPQPVVLPPLWGFPCLLLPRPDVLLPFFTVSEIQLALPAAVRPIDVWMQRAGLMNGQVFTAESFVVRAF
jgi:hypothetical protein